MFLFFSCCCLLSFFGQTFVFGYPLFSLYVSQKHEGVIFLHCPLATKSDDGMLLFFLCVSGFANEEVNTHLLFGSNNHMVGKKAL